MISPSTRRVDVSVPRRCVVQQACKSATATAKNDCRRASHFLRVILACQAMITCHHFTLKNKKPRTKKRKVPFGLMSEVFSECLCSCLVSKPFYPVTSVCTTHTVAHTVEVCVRTDLYGTSFEFFGVFFLNFLWPVAKKLATR